MDKDQKTWVKCCDCEKTIIVEKGSEECDRCHEPMCTECSADLTGCSQCFENMMDQ